MKIYFTASQSQGEKYGSYYKLIADAITESNHSLDAGTLFNDNEHPLDSESGRKKWYKESIRRITKADIVIAEVSYPSTANVGHELSYALEKGKPVIAMYKKGQNPVFLNGIVNEKLILVEYTDESLVHGLKDGLDVAADLQDTRFNFFISPKHQNYMDWLSKHRKVPRAVFLRRLIERSMDSDADYNEE